jgi:uncharacterized protein (DUF885 family)
MWTSEEEMTPRQNETKSKIGALVSWMDVNQAKTEGNHEELMATMKANQERMEALMDVSIEMMEVCLENIEVNHKKVEIMMEVSGKDGREDYPSTGGQRLAVVYWNAQKDE